MERFESLSHFTVICAVLVGVVSVARTARLLTYDDFPPVKWLRLRYLALVGPDSPWAMLARCQFCLCPYLTVGMFGWAYLSGLDVWWWSINGLWAASYASAMVVSYDEPPEQ